MMTRVSAGTVPTSPAKSHTQPGIAGMIALGTGSPSDSAIAVYLAESIAPQEWPVAPTLVRSTGTCSPDSSSANPARIAASACGNVGLSASLQTFGHLDNNDSSSGW